MIVGADGADDSYHPRHRVPLSTPPMDCAGSTTRRSVPSRTPSARSSAQGTAPASRTPSISGRLALSLLRFCGRRAPAGGWRARCSTSNRPEARLGPAEPSPLPGPILTGPAVRSFCVCLVSVCAASVELKLRRHRAIRLEELNQTWRVGSKIAPFVVGSGHGGTATSPALLDRIDLRARIAPRQLAAS